MSYFIVSHAGDIGAEKTKSEGRRVYLGAKNLRVSRRRRDMEGKEEPRKHPMGKTKTRTDSKGNRMATTNPKRKKRTDTEEEGIT